MKIFKCPNCKRVYEKANDIICVRCVCGYPTEHVDEKHEVIE